MTVHLCSCSRVNPDTFRLARRLEHVNILAHPEKRFYNSAIPNHADTEERVFSLAGKPVFVSRP
jgi:hypothetical protein